MAAFSSPSKEKFLIVDVTSSGASALFLDFDERRELSFKKLAENIDFEKFLASQAKSVFQKSWEGNYFFNSRRRLVVLADASLATTIPVPLDFKREPALAHKPVTLEEAEDWFARVTAKIFTRCRLEAARRLGTSDIDTVLVSQRTQRIVIDGHAAHDLVGHVGKKISIVMELTFANRELVGTLMPFFNAPGEFFFAEAPQARLAALAHVKPLPLSIIAAHGGKSSLFVFQEGEKNCPVVYREPFLWDASAAVRGIAANVGVTVPSAREIYDTYIHGEVSEAAKKYFDALIAPLSERFLQALDKADVRGSVYIDAPQDPPLKIPYRRRRAVIEDVPVTALLEKFGFSVVDKTNISSRIVLRYLAPFFELYFDNNRSELNELLRRKLHWLA